jgi:hypothetical protein
VSNVIILEVVVENGYRKEDAPSFDGIGGDEQQWGVDVKQHRSIWYWTIR